MSDRLTAALEKFPNLASRALVMLLQDPRNVKIVEAWIERNAENDIRFARLGAEIRKGKSIGDETCLLNN